MKIKILCIGHFYTSKDKKRLKKSALANWMTTLKEGQTFLSDAFYQTVSEASKGDENAYAILSCWGAVMADKINASEKARENFDDLLCAVKYNIPKADNVMAIVSAKFVEIYLNPSQKYV